MAPSPASNPSAAEPFSPPTKRTLALRALTAQREGRVPGLAAGVARNGTLVWDGGFGLARLDPPQQVTPSTRFQVASNTKTFVAVVIMALRDEGKLDLDEPIERHLPGTPLSAATVRQLLSHSSGIQREAVGDVFDTLEFPDRDGFVASLQQSERLLPPSAHFHYSNLGFALIGELIGRLDGGDWFASIRRRILEPLGMTQTTLGFPGGYENDSDAAGTYFVPPYSDVPLLEPVWDSGAIAPAAGMVSSMRDLAVWGGFIANPRPEILRPETLEEMCRPQVVADPERWNAAWGLGFALIRNGDRVWVGHTGGWAGAITGVFTERESATTGIALMNATNSPDPAQLAIDLGATTNELEPVLPPAWTPGTTVDSDLEQLLGVWFSEGTEFVFFVEHGTLKAKVAGQPAFRPPAVFEKVGVDTFRTVSGRERGEWLRVARGANNVVSHMNWATYRFTRDPLEFGGWLQ